jgi:hypothetical protein
LAYGRGDEDQDKIANAIVEHCGARLVPLATGANLYLDVTVNVKK